MASTSRTAAAQATRRDWQAVLPVRDRGGLGACGQPDRAVPVPRPRGLERRDIGSCGGGSRRPGEVPAEPLGLGTQGQAERDPGDAAVLAGLGGRLARAWPRDEARDTHRGLDGSARAEEDSDRAGYLLPG